MVAKSGIFVAIAAIAPAARMCSMKHAIDATETAGLIARLHDAVGAGKLSGSAADNIRAWLTEPHYAEYAPHVAEHILGQRWQALDDAFWAVIPFGTGGRRGRMYPIGTNAINDRTIGESAAGLASYVLDHPPADAGLACAIAYDSRHHSQHFARLCGEIMAAAGFQVFFLDDYRSTPELSFAVRYKHCACGLMITASHNPPSDNAVKVYWSSGGQLLPPHDGGVIERVKATTHIARLPWSEAVAAGKIELCQEEIDREYQRQVLAHSRPGPRGVKIVYSPMHGVGAASICPVLAAAGFADVELFMPQAAPDGDFRNVPGHVPNPENARTMDPVIERANETEADLVLSTDPDADRLGCAARLAAGGAWQVLTGNQIGALLTDYVLDSARQAGQLPKDGYVIKTLVTSEMIRRIATSYGIETFGNLQVGFKHIGAAIDTLGPERFLLGVEESHGYLVGNYARDKDATVAALLMSEIAAKAKAARQTVHEKLDALYWQHGCHVEVTYSKNMPGHDGAARTRKLMLKLRNSPPAELGGLKVVRMRDYLSGQMLATGTAPQPFDGPPGDMVVLELAAEGNSVAVRPSGTEPKVKFYLFAYQPPELLADLEHAKSELAARLKRIGQELFALADSS
jgi:phosphoglucomutase/phosphomannomutase